MAGKSGAEDTALQTLARDMELGGVVLRVGFGIGYRTLHGGHEAKWSVGVHTIIAFRDWLLGDGVTGATLRGGALCAAAGGAVV